MSDAKVATEATTGFPPNNARRLDIRIGFDAEPDFGVPSFGIGIENKAWAGEQQFQLSDYVTELNTRYKSNFVLVVIAPMPWKPTSISERDWDHHKRNGNAVKMD